MKRLLLLTLTVSAFSLSALAQNVATVVSIAPFTLDGHSVNTPGVPSHPLVSGDTITTGSSPVTVTLSNGQTATIAPNSTIKIGGTAASPAVNVTSGSMTSGNSIYTSSVPPTAPTGNKSLYCGSWWY